MNEKFGPGQSTAKQKAKQCELLQAAKQRTLYIWSTVGNVTTNDVGETFNCIRKHVKRTFIHFDILEHAEWNTLTHCL